MIKFLKNLFQKPPAPVKSVTRVLHDGPSVPVVKVETASLSLAAIIARFPADLKSTIAAAPDPNVMVALPLSTILKQLPGGSVKMSLASIYRQAPAGTFSSRVEEKRMVEIPLGEIFKRVKPELLKRRDDQRMHELAEEEGFDVFGDPENPYAVAPTVPKAPEPAPTPAPIAPPPSLRLASAKAPIAVEEEELRIETLPVAPAKPLKVEPPRETKPIAAALKSDAGPVVLPLPDISTGWPADILAEIGSLTGSTVTLPAAGVTAGLAKGKVAFTWGEIRSWITPTLTEPSAARDAIELQIPLRIVAPAFLKSSKDGGSRKRLTVDDSIPTLFAGGPPKPEPVQKAVTPPEPEPEAAAEPETQPIPSPVIPESIAPPQPDDAEPASEPEHVLAAPAHEHEPAHISGNVGNIFGQPDKTDWTPADIVKAVVKLPQVAGAVVALQEGLVVAHSLPENMKGDVVAAFLPQIFGRLNQYSGEMKLGEIDDVLMCTHGAYFQIFRLGYVFFAVLGKPGESLPWQELRVLAEELTRQTQK